MEDIIKWLIFAALFGVPLGGMARKAGRSPMLGLLALVPFGLLIGLAIIAYGPWPSQDGVDANG